MGAIQHETRGGTRVLVVDDDPEVVELTEIYLERQTEVTVVGETDPERALQRVRAESFDCIVSDYRMPAMDGVEFCRQAHERAPVPCIVFTSADDPDVRDAVETAGFGLVYKRGTDGYDNLAEQVRESTGQTLAA
jgi:CheY-like chemotaxis protein